MNNLIIGIAGGSGSGKTTLALRLKERFGEDEVRLISHDSYYKRHDELPFEERCKLNYDHPDAFDNALLIYHLQELKAGRAIDCPVYDYSNHNRSDDVTSLRFKCPPHSLWACSAEILFLISSCTQKEPLHRLCNGSFSFCFSG